MMTFLKEITTEQSQYKILYKDFTFYVVCKDNYY